MKQIFKQLLCILLLIAFIGGNTQMLATQGDPDETPWIYQILEEYDYALQPGMNAIVGGLLLGPYGAVAGIAAGVLDEMLRSSKWDHFSAGLMGMILANKVPLEGKLKLITGFVSGFSMSALAGSASASLTDKAEGPLQGLINGATYGGPKGAIVGVVAGAIDEGLVHWNITSDKYLMQTLATVTPCKIILPLVSAALQKVPYVGSAYQTYLLSLNIPYVIEGIGVAWVSYSLFYKEEETEDNKQTTNAIEIYGEMKDTLNNIGENEKMNSMLRRQLLFLVSARLLSSKLNQSFSCLQQKFLESLTSLRDHHTFSLPIFYISLSKITGFVFPFFQYYISTDIINGYFHKRLIDMSEQELRNIYLEGENVVKLAGPEDIQSLLSQMNKNIHDTVEKGTKITKSAIKSAVGGGYHALTLLQYNSLDMAVIMQCYNKLTEKLTIWLNAEQSDLKKKTEDLKSKVDLLQKELIQNAKEIHYGGNKELVAEKQRKLLEKFRNTEDTYDINNDLIASWGYTKEILDFTIRIAFIAPKVIAGEIPYSEWMQVFDASGSVSNAFSWYSTNSARITEFQHASNATQVLTQQIKSQIKNENSTIQYETIKGPQNAIQLKDFSVGHSDGTLLKEQTLNLETNAIAISGASGSGKSSFLSKIQGMKYNNIWGKGKVTYQTEDGKDPIIHQATQNDYITPYSNLQEIILSRDESQFNESVQLNQTITRLAKEMNIKSEDDKQLESVVTELLREIKIDSANDDAIVNELNVTKDWRTILSGGQKKKVAILKTIFNNPDIAIMDEVFNGLDSVSVINTQRMLKKYLPNTLFLFVDHNLKQNNYKHDEIPFYDQNLHLENQTLHWRDL